MRNFLLSRPTMPNSLPTYVGVAPTPISALDAASQNPDASPRFYVRIQRCLHTNARTSTPLACSEKKLRERLPSPNVDVTLTSDAHRVATQRPHLGAPCWRWRGMVRLCLAHLLGADERRGAFADYMCVAVHWGAWRVKNTRTWAPFQVAAGCRPQSRGMHAPDCDGNGDGSRHNRMAGHASAGGSRT